jgi:inosose dehydratase
MKACEPAVELLLDTGHLVFAGGDPVRAAGNHANRIAHVHCKDIRHEVLKQVLNADTSFLEAVLQGVFTVPGDGCIDYDAVFRPLRTAGYEGWLVIEAEQDPAIADPMTYATLGYRTLLRLAQWARPYNPSASTTSAHDTYLKFCRSSGAMLRPSCTTSNP